MKIYLHTVTLFIKTSSSCSFTNGWQVKEQLQSTFCEYANKEDMLLVASRAVKPQICYMCMRRDSQDILMWTDVCIRVIRHGYSNCIPLTGRPTLCTGQNTRKSGNAQKIFPVIFRSKHSYNQARVSTKIKFTLHKRSNKISKRKDFIHRYTRNEPKWKITSVVALNMQGHRVSEAWKVAVF